MLIASGLHYNQLSHAQQASHRGATHVCVSFSLYLLSASPPLTRVHVHAFVCTGAFGANGCGCGSQRGCCGSCCSASFDEDAFDAEERKRAEREAKTKKKGVSEQPKRADGMHMHANGAPPPKSKEETKTQSQEKEKEAPAGPETRSADTDIRGADTETTGGPPKPRAETEQGRENGVHV